MLRTRLDGKHGKATGPQTSLQLRRLPVRPEGGQGQTHPRAFSDLNSKDTETTLQADLSGPADVPDRVVNSYRRPSPPRLTPYEADTVALGKTEGTRIPRQEFSRIVLSPAMV